jgi:hypothetical protein
MTWKIEKKTRHASVDCTHEPKTVALIAAVDAPESIDMDRFQSCPAQMHRAFVQDTTRYELELEHKRAVAMAHVERNRFRFI